MIKDQDVRSKVLDTTRSFLVQAPAGSGKTAILVQRFLTALARAKAGPEEIVAITFTRKAAAEMRERILDALQLATHHNPPTNAYKLSLWTIAKQVLERDAKEGWQLLNNPARLKIQTIDALCASITKQMPILSQFGAQPQIEQHPAQLYELAVDQLFQALDQETSHPEHKGLFKLLRHLDNDRFKVKKLLMQMLQKREHWLPTIAQHMHAQNLRQYLEQGLIFACEETVEDLHALVPSVLDVAIMSQDEPQSLDEWLSIVDKLLTAEGAWRKTVGVDQGFHPPSKAKNKDEKQRLKECKDAMLAMLDRLRPHEEFRQQLAVLRELPPLMYTDQQWEIVAALIEVLPLLAAQLTVVFRDQGQVDFVAVALAALMALQDQDAPTDLSLALDYKIRHILVDEFQDTSHIQFRLLEYLTMSWDPDDGKTLFLVGDPMQSIYRFRQADVGLFLKAKEHGIGKVQLEFVQLTVNFRSTASIMQWINRVFTHSFPKADNKTLGAITYMPAQAADEKAQAYNAVECYAVCDVAEPSEIVRIIQQAQLENPHYSIAILVRAKNHLFKILPALRAAKIAYHGIDIENLSKRPLVQDLLALTRAMLHLEDRIAWLAVLRAPWCALTLAELQIVAQFPGTIFAGLQSLEVILKLAPATQKRVHNFVAVMRDQLALLERVSLSVLVKAAFTHIGGQYCLRDASASFEIEAFFTLLASLENKQEIYNPGYLEQQLDRLFLQPSNVDQNAAVQIMTMHKAKGLEFDIVILPGLTKTTLHQEQQMLLLEQRDYAHEYLLLAPIRAADQKTDAIYNYMAWCEKQREEYEMLRQLYVAATRAKKQIYCLGDVAQANNVGGMLGKIWPQLEEQFIYSVQAADVMAQRNLDLVRLPDAWFMEHNIYTSININSAKRTLKQWQPNWVNQAGTIMHRFLWRIATIGLENLDPNFFKSMPDICKEHLRVLGLAPVEQRKAAQLIIQAITTMVHDKLGAKILCAQHKEAYAEWCLTSIIEDKFKQVRLDRVFVDANDVLWLVDYKLVQDSANISQAIQSNKQQLDAYVQVLQQIKPGFKLVAGLYFPVQALWHQIY